jgi:hypothetical protein
MLIDIEGEIWFWRGPAPWYFVTVPPAECRALRAISSTVTYGWGMIPATVQIGHTRWTTALWPQEERYIVPIKAQVRKAEGLAEGDCVTLCLEVG